MAADPAQPHGAGNPSPFTPKRIVIGVLVLVALVLILTNFEDQTVNLLWAKIEMPLALLLATMFGLGWVAAMLTSRLRGSKD
jgi:uncharacterized membrane protein YciS (DUF1049 family)